MNNILNIIVSVLIALVICYFLLAQIKPQQILATIISIPKLSLAIGFAVYAIFILLKTIRFKMLLRDSIPIKRLYPIVSLYTFFGNFLPMRTGEISYVYMLKKRERVSMTKSTASLLVASVWELLFLLLIAAISAWTLRSALSGRLSSAVLFILFILPMVGTLAVGMALFSASMFTGIWAQPVEKISAIANSSKSRSFRFLGNKLSDFIKELGDMSLKSRVLWIAFSSFAVVASRLIMQCYLVKAMSMNIGAIGAVEIISALSFTTFINFIPIQGIAGFGSLELPWALSLMAFNVPKESAILSGFSLHIIIICYSVVIGIYGLATSIINVKREM